MRKSSRTNSSGPKSTCTGLANKNEEVIAKREQARKAKEQMKMEGLEEGFNKEEQAEFDENEHREAIKLNELMKDFKLEPENQEEEQTNINNICSDIGNLKLGDAKNETSKE